MKWAAKIGTVSGIKIYVHATFLILIAWIALVYWSQYQDVIRMLQGIGFIILLFVCVVLHELGHALTAQRFGIRTRDIILLPIGGVARLERIPEDPWQEFLVAIAGPAVNVVIAGVLYLGLQLTGGITPLGELGVAEGSLATRLMLVNVVLVVFNMLPAFPMDGGRVLRALLATRLPYEQATAIAAAMGQSMAYVFGIIGFFFNPFLIFIAIFVWIGAAHEANAAQLRVALGGIPVSRAMVTEFHTVQPSDTMTEVVQYILSGSQHDFPVVEEGAVVGVLTRSEVMQTLARGGMEIQVQQAMQKDCVTVDASETLEAVLPRLQEAPCKVLPVLRNGDLAGLLTMDNLGEFIMIRTALGKRKRSAKITTG